MKGVSFKSILISFPRPEAALSANAFKKLPLSFEPTEYFVLLSAPLTFLTFNSDSSVSVNSKIFTSFAVATDVKKRNKLKIFSNDFIN